MTKKLELELSKLEFFKAIRKKKHLVCLLLEILINFKLCSPKKDFSSVLPIIEDENTIRIYIYIDKMQRIFFCTKDKVQSFSLPFSVKYNEESEIEFTIDNRNIEVGPMYFLLGIFKQEFSSLAELIDKINDDEFYQKFDEYTKLLVDNLALQLLLFEDGYLRFDYNDCERQNGAKHPINHIDFYYSDGNTFKMGITKVYQLEEHIKILDLNQDCVFIEE